MRKAEATHYPRRDRTSSQYPESMASPMAEFTDLEEPAAYYMRHDFGSEGYALLSVMKTSTFVVATLASPRHLPSWNVCPINKTMRTAVRLVEEQFATDFPEHLCTEKCRRLMEELLPISPPPHGHTGMIQ